MANIDITFEAKKGSGTLAAALQVKEVTPPGTPPAPWQSVKLKNGKGIKQLQTTTTYDLGYAFMGQPGGTLQIIVTDPNKTVLLDKSDTIPANDLSREDTCALIIP